MGSQVEISNFKVNRYDRHSKMFCQVLNDLASFLFIFSDKFSFV